MVYEIEHNHGKSVLSALRYNFNSVNADKIRIISDCGGIFFVSSNFIKFFSKVISRTSDNQDVVIFVPLKSSTVGNLLTFLYNGELFDKEMEDLTDLLEAAKILDIDIKNWSIVGLEKDEMDIDVTTSRDDCIVNFENNYQVKAVEVKLMNIKKELLSTADAYQSVRNAKKHYNSLHSQQLKCNDGHEVFKVENYEVDPLLPSNWKTTFQKKGESVTTLDNESLYPEMKLLKSRKTVAEFMKVTDNCYEEKNINGRHFGKPNNMQFENIDGNLRCEYCGKIFKSKLALQYHVISSHIKPLQKEADPVACEKCKKLFKNKVALLYHESSFHGQMSKRKEEKVSCDKCKKKFKSKVGLQYHQVRSHAIDRDHVSIGKK